MLRPEEVEMLVCGNPNLNMADLKRVTVYDGYSANDVTIRYVMLYVALSSAYIVKPLGLQYLHRLVLCV